MPRRLGLVALVALAACTAAEGDYDCVVHDPDLVECSPAAPG